MQRHSLRILPVVGGEDPHREDPVPLVLRPQSDSGSQTLFSQVPGVEPVRVPPPPPPSPVEGVRPSEVLPEGSILVRCGCVVVVYIKEFAGVVGRLFR